MLLNSKPTIVALILSVVAACSEAPAWVQVERPILNSDLTLWYEPSSIRKIGNDKAIINVKWVNSMGVEAIKGVMRFNCQQRLFITTDSWTNSDGNGFKPSFSEFEEKELSVLPNGPIESVMDAACG